MEYFAKRVRSGLISLAALVIFYRSAMALARASRSKARPGPGAQPGRGALNGLLGWFLLNTGAGSSPRRSGRRPARAVRLLHDRRHLRWPHACENLRLQLARPPSSRSRSPSCLRTGVGLVRESAAALLDEEDSATIGKIVLGLNVLLKDGVEEAGDHGARPARHPLRTLHPCRRSSRRSRVPPGGRSAR